MLGERKRPLIYAGGGVINGRRGARAARVRDAFGIPVVTTLMGLGAFDTTQPLSLHMLGMHGTAFANYAVDDCDFLIALGARFDDRVAGVPAKFAREREAHRAHRHRPAEIDKVKRVRLASRRPAWARRCDALIAYGRAHELQPRLRARGTAQIAELKRTYAMNYDRDSAADPAALRDRRR